MNIETIKSVYFVGASGIGMSALVRYFLFKGKAGKPHAGGGCSPGGRC